MGEQDSVPTPEELTSPSRATERRAKDDSSRRVVKSTQDLSNVSMDEVGIPLRVRMDLQVLFGLHLKQVLARVWP